MRTSLTYKTQLLQSAEGRFGVKPSRTVSRGTSASERTWTTHRDVGSVRKRLERVGPYLQRVLEGFTPKRPGRDETTQRLKEIL
jgi:hypothetical protein